MRISIRSSATEKADTRRPYRDVAKKVNELSLGHGARLGGGRRRHSQGGEQRPPLRDPFGPDQQVDMVGEQGACVDGCPAHLDHGRQPADELVAVQPVPKEGGALHSPHHPVVQDAGRIQPGPPLRASTVTPDLVEVEEKL